MIVQTIKPYFIQIIQELLINILKDGNVLVDTPGIGGSGEVTEKLLEYIPNAVAFIFVIDVSSAGGLQRDRVNLNWIYINIRFLSLRKTLILYIIFIK